MIDGASDAGVGAKWVLLALPPRMGRIGTRKCFNGLRQLFGRVNWRGNISFPNWSVVFDFLFVESSWIDSPPILVGERRSWTRIECDRRTASRCHWTEFSPSDFTGFGIQVSGVAAWDSGVAGTAIGGTSNIGLPGGATYSGATDGVVVGAGGSVAAELTYTSFVGSMNFSQAPQNVQTAFCKAIGGC